MKIIVAGYMVAYPFAGPTWQGLNFILGLRQMGHEVYFLEDSGDYSWPYDPSTGKCEAHESSYGRKYVEQVFGRFGMSGRWCYYNQFANQHYGMTESQLDELCRTADLFLNVSTVNPLRDRYRQARITAAIDTDPVFNQIRMLQEPAFRELYLRHDHQFTIALNLGNADCPIPDAGIRWKKIPQPIYLDFWRNAEPASAGSPYTTVMNWRSYRNVEYQGRSYGQKDVEFQAFFHLPTQVQVPLEVAITKGAPNEELKRAGWRVADANHTTLTLDAYQQYIRQSRGEWAIAKNGYVLGQCGWFSERSAQYLASGRPVLAQDTAFQHWLPVGEGLLDFRNVEDVQLGFEVIEKNYERHCRMARHIAEEYFDSQKVLSQLLEQL